MTAFIAPSSLVPVEPLFGCLSRDALYFEGLAQEVYAPIFSWSDIPCESDHLFVENDVYSFNDSAAQSYQYAANCSSETRIFERSHRLSDMPLTAIENKLSCKSRREANKYYHELEGLHCDTHKKTRKSPKSVHFSPALEIRTHSIVVGDHPCCTGGMALECGWEYLESELIDVDVYERENFRRRGSCSSRHTNSFRLNFSARRDRLMQVTGLTGTELLQEEYLVICGSYNLQTQSTLPLRPLQTTPTFLELHTVVR